MTAGVLEGLVRAAGARAERLAAGPAPGAPERPAPSFRDAIAGRDPLSVIAEFKRKSPSAGAIRDDDPGARALAYREAGASAVSVLTDPDAFGGSLEDLRAAAAASGLPILMKDFIVDPVQVRAGWAAGASAVLLIVRCLDDARLRHLYREARSLGLDTLIEVHDAAELERPWRSRTPSWGSTTGTWTRCGRIAAAPATSFPGFRPGGSRSPRAGTSSRSI